MAITVYTFVHCNLCIILQLYFVYSERAACTGIRQPYKLQYVHTYTEAEFTNVQFR
jgi:hypothetical protein